MHILHLEDDALDADLVHREVARHEADTTWTTVDSAEAFHSAMKQARFDAIVSDNRVPGIDGPVALITLDNGFDHTKPNSFGPAGLAAFDAALDRRHTLVVSQVILRHRIRPANHFSKQRLAPRIEHHCFGVAHGPPDGHRGARHRSRRTGGRRL